MWYRLFEKIIIQRLKKYCFTIAITILFYFSAILKISLRSYMFLLIQIIFIIFHDM
jgi:hypothetical protein